MPPLRSPARPQPHLELQRIGLVHTAPERRDGVTQGDVPYRWREKLDGVASLCSVVMQSPQHYHDHLKPVGEREHRVAAGRLFGLTRRPQLA